MPSPADDRPSPLDAFLAAFRADTEADAVRPLAEYLARFPGDERGIAREYLAIQDVAGGTPSAASADRISHYRILRELGRGGQATVYLADGSRYADIARYWLTSGRRRPVFPGARMTRGEVADALIRPEAPRSEIMRAYDLDPTHPLVQIALSRFEEDPRRRTFLRDFGFNRIAAAPSPQPACTPAQGLDQASLAEGGTSNFAVRRKAPFHHPPSAARSGEEVRQRVGGRWRQVKDRNSRAAPVC